MTFGIEVEGSCFSRAILFESAEAKDQFLGLTEVPATTKLVDAKTGEIFVVSQAPIKESKEVVTGFTPSFVPVPVVIPSPTAPVPNP